MKLEISTGGGKWYCKKRLQQVILSAKLTRQRKEEVQHGQTSS